MLGTTLALILTPVFQGVYMSVRVDSNREYLSVSVSHSHLLSPNLLYTLYRLSLILMVLSQSYRWRN